MVDKSFTHASSSPRSMVPLWSWSKQRHANSFVAVVSNWSLDALMRASPAANSEKVIRPVPSWSYSVKIMSVICFTLRDRSQEVLATCCSICVRQRVSPSAAPMS